MTLRLFFLFLNFFLFHSLSYSMSASQPCRQSIADQKQADTVRVALVQYEMGRISSLEAWENKLHHDVREAAQAGATVVLFPELLSIEGLTLAEFQGVPVNQAIRRLGQVYTPHFKERFAAWSREHAITILSGSWPVVRENGDTFNTAFVFGPDGQLVHLQEKNHLTRDEKEDYRLSEAKGNCRPFRLSNADAGIAICFDVEFPNYLPFAEGVIPEILFVPSMTGDSFGRYRVLRSASARAIEYHTYVLVTGTVGGEATHPLIGTHEGQAMVLSPSDRLFPASGILSQGPLNERHVLVFDLDLRRLRESRRTSTTFPVKIIHGTP